MDFIRATGTWSGWSVVSTDDIAGSNVDNYSVRRATVQNAKYGVVAARSGAPQPVSQGTWLRSDGVLFGAEFSAVYAHSRGSQVASSPHARTKPVTKLAGATN